MDDHNYAKKITNKKNYKRCCVPGCGNRLSESILLHRLPKDPEVRKSWIQKCQIGTKVTRWDVVCSAHFVAADYKSRDTVHCRFLWSFAVPNQNLPPGSTKFAANTYNANNVSLKTSLNFDDDYMNMETKLENAPHIQLAQFVGCPGVNPQLATQSNIFPSLEFQKMTKGTSNRSDDVDNELIVPTIARLTSSQTTIQPYHNQDLFKYDMVNNVNQDADNTVRTRIGQKHRPGCGHICCVPKCTSSANRTGRKYSFFSMPKNKIRLVDWLRAICRMDLIPIARERSIHNYLVCGKHFETSMFLNDMQNSLHPSAIPFLYLPIKGDTSIMSERLMIDSDDSNNTSSSDMYNNLTEFEFASVKKELVDEDSTDQSTEPSTSDTTEFQFNINQPDSIQEPIKTNQNYIESAENSLNIKTEIEEEPQVEEELPSALPTMSFVQELVMVKQFAQNHFNSKLAKLVGIQCDLLKLEGL